jgi:hypothetical protein
MALTLEERFWTKVDKKPNDPFWVGCWEWTAAIVGPKPGYGVINCRENKKTNLKLAHRLSYECANRSIPEGYDIDHLCRNSRCVNPGHLEAVPHRENLQRGRNGQLKLGKHCKHGHEWDGFTVSGRGGRRQRRCRQCHNELTLRGYHRRKALRCP